MNAVAKIEAEAPFAVLDDFDRVCALRHELADTRAMLGQAIHGLNLASKALDRLGGDGDLYRELAELAMPVRWAR